MLKYSVMLLMLKWNGELNIYLINNAKSFRLSIAQLKPGLFAQYRK